MSFQLNGRFAIFTSAAPTWHALQLAGLLGTLKAYLLQGSLWEFSCAGAVPRDLAGEVREASSHSGQRGSDAVER